MGTTCWPDSVELTVSCTLQPLSSSVTFETRLKAQTGGGVVGAPAGAQRRMSGALPTQMGLPTGVLQLRQHLEHMLACVMHTGHV